MALDLAPGAKVAVILGNSPVSVAVMVALKATDLVCVPLLPSLPVAAISAALATSGIALAIIEDPGKPHGGIASDLPVVSPAMLEEEQGPARDVTPRAPDDTKIILHTSGSTGTPKGVMIPFRAIDSWGPIFSNEMLGLRDDDYLLFGAHISGAIANCLLETAQYSGAAIAIPSRPTPEDLATTFREGRVSVVLGVPWLGHMMLRANDLHPGSFDTLRRVVMGGATVDTGLVEQLNTAFGCEVGVTYALSECAPTTVLPDAIGKQSGCVGAPVSTAQVKILTEGTAPDTGPHLGEIALRGEQSALGYIGLPEQTARAFRDGWFHSGDLGYIDSDGNLHIVDRMADVFLVGGTKVYPSAPEAVLRRHPAVADVAVTGIDHPKLQKVSAAWVIPAKGMSPTAVDLIRWCKDHLQAAETPRHIYFVDEFPRNPIGKVLRNKLVPN